MAAKFEIHSPNAGEYRWVLVSQGRILATSEAYNRRGTAEKAIVSFRMVAVNAPVLDTTQSPATTAGRAARATGRAVAKAVVRSGRTVENLEKAGAKTAKRAAKRATRVVKKGG
jgi:uncharacterized protein YegP (UPF0339 family)